MSKINIIFMFLLPTIGIAQTGTPQGVTPASVTGCVLKHIIYDERPVDVWLAYGTRAGVEVKLLGTTDGKNGDIKAEKLCHEWLRQTSPKRKQKGAK